MIISLSLILVISLGLVSAGWFSDLFGSEKITGRDVDPNVLCDLTGRECDRDETQVCTTTAGYPGTKICNYYCNAFRDCESTQSCGDGSRNGPEQCDDGNVVSGDGCSSSCQIEMGECIITSSPDARPSVCDDFDLGSGLFNKCIKIEGCTRIDEGCVLQTGYSSLSCTDQDWDSCELLNECDWIVEVTSEGLEAKFTATQVPDSLRVIFNAGTSTGDISSYSWNFRDGSSDTRDTAGVGHTYATGGTYSVILIITDSDGNTDSKTESVTVSAPTGIGDGGDCTGTAQVCDSNPLYNNELTCETQDGCTWIWEQDPCVGTATACDASPVNTNQATCEAQRGCSWSEGGGDGGGDAVVVAGPSCDADSDKGLDRLPLGQRQEGSDDVLYYCSLDQDWKAAKPTYDINCDAGDDECTSDGEISTSEATCISNYECMSNACADGLCFSVRKELSAQRLFLYKIFCTVTNLGEYIGEGDEIAIYAEDYQGLIDDDVAPGYGECMLDFVDGS